MSEVPSIRVNFGRPMPLFPLDTAVLLPQQVIPLHIFEPRYRQLVGHVLDGSGQFAMGVYESKAFKNAKSEKAANGLPAIRSVVCIAQIAEHEVLPGGRYNIVVQGICRAQVVEEVDQEDQLYRSAVLSPLIDDQTSDEALAGMREWMGEMLDEGPLRHLAAAETVLAYVRNSEVPTTALLELIGFALTSDAEDRYQLLAEPNAQIRAKILKSELSTLGSLLNRAAAQSHQDWPKGCSWN